MADFWLWQAELRLLLDSLNFLLRPSQRGGGGGGSGTSEIRARACPPELTLLPTSRRPCLAGTGELAGFTPWRGSRCAPRRCFVLLVLQELSSGLRTQGGNRGRDKDQPLGMAKPIKRSGQCFAGQGNNLSASVESKTSRRSCTSENLSHSWWASFRGCLGGGCQLWITQPSSVVYSGIDRQCQ